ncbi:hypothetical protein TsocGM_24425, partial [Tautonia sociabilis]
MDAERRGDDPARDAQQPAPGRPTWSADRLKWAAMIGLAILIGIASLAVARVSPWLVPPYLLLMGWILLGPRGTPQDNRPEEAEDPGETRAADRPAPVSGPSPGVLADDYAPPIPLTPTPAPSEAAEEPAPSPRGLFGRRSRRLDPPQPDPAPNPAPTAAEPARSSAVRGWFSRRSRSATQPLPADSPEAPAEPESEPDSEPGPPPPP